MPTELDRIQNASVQERADIGGIGMQILLMGPAANELIAPWWSKTRDAQLRKFWRLPDHLAGAVYTMESRLKTVPFHVQPRDFAVKAHVKQANEFEELLLDEADFWGGWGDFYSKWVEDVLTQDSGGFAEIIGDGKPDGPIVGKPFGLAHLDSWACQRTSDPEFPVIYQSAKGQRYKLHWTRVMSYAQMPSPSTPMRGTGMCAVSRCINVAQALLDTLVYRQEKLGSRPHRSFLVTSGGLDPEDIRKAFQLAEEVMDSQQLRRYSKTVAIGDRQIPEAKVELIDLASLPDGFNWRDDVTLSMAAISLAFGVDARELFPGLDSGATRAEALIAHIKQRGKGPGEILETTERLLNAKFLPPHLEIVFDFQDDEQDRQQAEIKKARSDRHVNMATAGLLDSRTMREQMLEDEDLTRSQFERLELEDGRLADGSDVLTLFSSTDHRADLDLGVNDPTDIEANSAADILAAIEERKRMLTAELARANSGRAAIIRQSIAALDRLKLLYGGRSAAMTAPKAPEARRTEALQEQMTEGGEGQMPPLKPEDLELKSLEELSVELAYGTKEWRGGSPDIPSPDGRAEGDMDVLTTLEKQVGHLRRNAQAAVAIELERKQRAEDALEVIGSLVEAIKQMGEVQPVINVYVPEQAAPQIVMDLGPVTAALRAMVDAIRQIDPTINVTIPEQPAPVVNVQTPEVPVQVSLEAKLDTPQVVEQTVTEVTRGTDGRIESTRSTTIKSPAK